MLAYEIKLKSFDKLDACAQALVIPLKDIAVALSQRIQDRVRKGVSPTGGKWQPLGTYSTTGRSKDEENRWWVAPGQPQPGGYMRKITAGQFQGWAVYENYGDYIDRLPTGRTRTWFKTGDMWRSMGVRAMAVNRVKISFYGTKGKQYGYSSAGGASLRRRGQAQVANWAGRNEGYSVLQYNDEERDAVIEAVKATIDETMARRIGEEAVAGKAARAQRLSARRASKLLGG